MSTTPSTITEAIESAALQGKQSVAAGGTNVTVMSIRDQIDAFRFTQGEAKKTNTTRGLAVNVSYGGRAGL